MVVGDVTHAHFRLHRLFHDIVSANRDFAFFKRKDAGQTFYGRGFARAVLAQKSENFAGFQFQRQILYGIYLAVGVPFFKVVDFKHRGRAFDDGVFV